MPLTNAGPGAHKREERLTKICRLLSAAVPLIIIQGGMQDRNDKLMT